MKSFSILKGLAFHPFRTKYELKKRSLFQSLLFAVSMIALSSCINFVFYVASGETFFSSFVIPIINAVASLFSLPLLFHLLVKLLGGRESFSRTFAPFGYLTAYLPLLSIFRISVSPLSIILVLILSLWVSFLLGVYLQECTGLGRIKLWIIWIIILLGTGSIFTYYYYLVLSTLWSVLFSVLVSS